MKILDTSFDSNVEAQPITSGTLDFLQIAYKEPISEIIKNLIGKEYDSNVVYLLNGGKLTPAIGDNYTVTSGTCFWNNEVFNIDGVGGIGISLPDNIGLTISTTYYTTNADPLTFYSGAVHNVHQIRKMEYYNDAGTPPILPPFNYLDDGSVNFGTYNQTDNLFPSLPTSMNNATLTFNKDANICWSTSSSTSNNINLDRDNAKQGVKVIINQNGSAGTPVSFTLVSGGSLKIMGNPFFDANGYFNCEITFLGLNNLNFIVNCLTTTTGALPVTSYYNGTYIDHSTIPLQLTKSDRRVYISGRLDNTVGLSKSAGQTQSLMTLPTQYRPSREIFGLGGFGDVTGGDMGSPSMGVNVLTSGEIILIGPFTNNTGYFKIEYDTLL